jgi:glycosyltransferase involved in cell wall biosynthesis
MNNPLVSIAVITYNQAAFIDEALTSALNQDYENLEVVVADDGSTDRTAEIILTYVQKYPGRLVALTGCPNLGVTGNSNRALKACKGKYIAFQGGDDILLPGKISRQVEWMETNRERVLCGHDVEIFESHSGRKLALWSENYPLRSGRGAALVVRYGVPFAATAVMVRADDIPSFGFDPRVSLVSDWKLWIDCLAAGREFGYVDGVYARYRTAELNLSRHTQAITQDILITLALVESSYPQLIRYCKYKRAQAYYDLGIHHMKNQNFSPARNLFQAALKTTLISWKLPIALLLTYLPISWSHHILQNRPTPRSLAEFILTIIKKQA